MGGCCHGVCGNLTEFTQVYWLTKMCSRYGKVVGAFTPESSRTGKGKRFGVFSFRVEIIVQTCSDDLNGSIVIVRKIVVKIAAYCWSQRRKTPGMVHLKNQ